MWGSSQKFCRAVKQQPIDEDRLARLDARREVEVLLTGVIRCCSWDRYTFLDEGSAVFSLSLYVAKLCWRTWKQLLPCDWSSLVCGLFYEVKFNLCFLIIRILLQQWRCIENYTAGVRGGLAVACWTAKWEVRDSNLARADIWIEISASCAPLGGSRIVDNIWRVVLHPP